MSMVSQYYVTLEEASAVVKRMGIATFAEYQERCSEDPKLHPNPSHHYSDAWQGVEMFLGIELKYGAMADAMAAVRRLKIMNAEEYSARYSEDCRLPQSPDQFYDEWAGENYFFGAKKRLVKYQTLGLAEQAVQRLNIKSVVEYRARYREDPRLPSNPARAYKEEWVSYPSFLKGVVEKYPTYIEAVDAVRALGICSAGQYKSLFHLDERLPSHPDEFYANDWPGFTEFLQGQNYIQSYATLADASAAAQKLGIGSEQEYRSSHHLDPSLAIAPNLRYERYWKGWANFLNLSDGAQLGLDLGSDEAAQQIPSSLEPSIGLEVDYHVDAKAASVSVKILGIKSKRDYDARRFLDPQLPPDPTAQYKDDWQTWESFLGLPPKKGYPSYSAASKAARALNFTSAADYRERYRIDPKLYGSPEVRYRDDWKGWPEFLGFRRGKKGLYPTYEEARAAVGVASFADIKDYKARYSEDPRLPSAPHVTYKQTWISWSDYLGKVEKYETFEECVVAIRALGVTTVTQYQARYMEDPRLPYGPDLKYPEWTSWPAVLRGVTLYPTLSEASEAARRLGHKSKEEYLKWYKKDSSLPSAPNFYYKEEWAAGGYDWDKYLGVHNEIYSYEGACLAVRRLGIKNQTDYLSRSKEDDKLPWDPQRIYSKEWQGWRPFLLPKVCESLSDVKQYVRVLGITNSVHYREECKKYPGLPARPDTVYSSTWVDWYDLCDVPRPYSYEEACDIVQAEQIKGAMDYSKFRRGCKDPRLPHDPSFTYEDKWVNWWVFLGKDEPYKTSNIHDPYLDWAKAINGFIRVARGGSSKELPLCKFVRHFVIPYGLSFKPEVFIVEDKLNVKAFTLLMEQHGERGAQGGFLLAVTEFADYVIKEYLTSVDEDTGEVVTAFGAENPFKQLTPTAPYLGQKYSESNKPALTYGYVKNLREWIVPESANSYSDLQHLHVFDADWVEIDPALVDIHDPDCVVKQEYGRTKIWSPISWMHTYALAYVPARGRQLGYNDSGEADSEIPEYVDGKIVWVKNTLPLAGALKNQGFIKRYEDDEIGMHFTSNKTSIAHRGYDVPWVPIELARWMIKLRNWQSKYNPIARPTPWTECKRTALNDSQLKAKKSNCFLFRDFGDVEVGHFSSRMTHRIACAIYHTQPKGMSLAKSDGNLHAISTYSSIYTAHSMRVSLITAYIVEMGLSVEVVMKLAGHSNMVMSIYYVKLNSGNLRSRFAAGEKRALADSATAEAYMLEQNRIDEIRDRLVENYEGGPRPYQGQPVPGSILVRDYGFCPFAGVRCGDGGKLIGKTKVREPVTAGYLGEQNCTRCRHLVTGPAFIGGLLSLANEISLNTSIQSDQFAKLELSLSETQDKIDVEEVKMFEADAANMPFDETEKNALEVKLRKTRSESESAAKKLDALLTDLQYVARLINRCQSLMNENTLDNGASKTQLIVRSGHEIQFSPTETSRFALYNEVCENAEIYESASAALAVAPRSQLLDRMMVFNDMWPKMSMLTEAQQLTVGNQMASFLYSRLKSFERVDLLVEGKIKFEDLSVEEGISTSEIDRIFVENGLEYLAVDRSESTHSDHQVFVHDIEETEE